MKVFVAGATGVLGWRTVRDLISAGHEVTGIARTEEKAARLRAIGATPIRVDLFDAEAVKAAVTGHDAIVNVATHVPPLSRAARRSAWHEHERIRSEGTGILVDAALAANATVFIQESLAFTYVDGGDAWLDEDTPLIDGGAATAVRAAESHVARFTEAGGRGIALRFGEFYSDDSSHTQAAVQVARRGLSARIGAPDGYAPVVAVDDAAAAVVAALDAPAGTFNAVDDEPMTRRELDTALARAVGGRRLVRPSANVTRLSKDAVVFRLSNRASNARFKAATGWAPRHPSAREGFAALARDLPGERTSLAQTVALAILGLSVLGIGVYATLFPRGFYDDFPYGRGWVVADGPYNEHLVRDFGGLNLGLALVALLAVLIGGRWLARAAAGSLLLFGVPHLVYHIRHRETLDGFDAVASLASLASVVVLAVLVLVIDRRTARGVTGVSV